jgi:hypothetical protein
MAPCPRSLPSGRCGRRPTWRRASLGALRRRLDRRGASAGRRRAAVVPARDALRARARPGRRSLRHEVYDRARGQSRAPEARRRPGSPIPIRRSTSTGCDGRPRADRRRRRILGRRVRADRIKKHERTRRVKEDDRTRHIVTLRAQTGIVLLTYRASAAIDAAVAAVTAHEPLYDFVAADGVAHQLWKAPAAERDAARRRLRRRARPLHRRRPSPRRLGLARPRRAARRPRPASRRRPAPATSTPSSRSPSRTTRCASSPTTASSRSSARSPRGLLAALERRFRFVDGPPQPERAGCVGLYLGDRWRTFVLDEAPAGASAAERLDCERLSRQVLSPLLGIEDLRTDARVDFVGGIRGTAELERWVDSGRAAVAFAMFPSPSPSCSPSPTPARSCRPSRPGSSPSCATDC